MNREAALLFYFAYGSNLWWPRMKQRVPSASRESTAVLSGFVFGFRKIGADGSAKADLEFTGQAKDRVHGAIYMLAAVDLPHLDRVEGGYHHASVLVEDADGRRRWALTYLASEPAAQPFAPFEWYQALIVAGARHHGLPHGYQEYLASFSAIQDPDRRRHSSNLEQCREA